MPTALTKEGKSISNKEMFGRQKRDLVSDAGNAGVGVGWGERSAQEQAESYVTKGKPLLQALSPHRHCTLKLKRKRTVLVRY